MSTTHCDEDSIYLFAAIAWASRLVLSWGLSRTLTTDFCLNAVLETLNHYGTPAIFNTDLDDQFTALKFTGLLKDDGIQISVDGQGCWRDNVFVEQIWNSIKYEEVYPHTYECGNDVREGLDIYHTFYNQRRSHTALDDNTPDTVSFKNLPVRSHTP